MEKIISCCGLNCATCDARIATITNDNELRKQTAQKWQEMYNAPNINPESINCTGCRTDGVKFAHCFECEIRNCADKKGFVTCAECNELETCLIVANIHSFVPEAKVNLLELK